MSSRLVLSFASLMFTAVILSGCVFSIEHGPLESGLYESVDSPRLLVCKDASGAHCDSVRVKTHLDVGTRWIKCDKYAGNTLFLRGAAQLGEFSGDTLRLFGYRDSSLLQDGSVFVPAKWVGHRQDTLVLIVDRRASRGFRARFPPDTAWVDFRKRR